MVGEIRFWSVAFCMTGTQRQSVRNAHEEPTAILTFLKDKLLVVSLKFAPCCKMKDLNMFGRRNSASCFNGAKNDLSEIQYFSPNVSLEAHLSG